MRDTQRKNKGVPGTTRSPKQTITDLLESSTLNRETVQDLETLFHLIEPQRASKIVNRVFIAFIFHEFDFLSRKEVEELMHIASFFNSAKIE